MTRKRRALGTRMVIRKWNHAFVLLANRSNAWKWQISSQINKKQTRWSNDKTIIELGYIAKYRPVTVNDVCVAMTTNSAARSY